MDVATRQPLGDPLRHAGVVVSVAFSPNGATLASVSADGTVRLWDVAARRPIGDPLRHADVMGVAFSPNGATLASASADGTVRLWDLPTFEAACSLANSGPLPSRPQFLEKLIDRWACEELETPDV